MKDASFLVTGHGGPIFFEDIMRLTTRYMIRRDLPQVLDIEKHLADPRGEDALLKELCRGDVMGLVVEHGNTILGFAILETMKRRVEVTRFAVHPEARDIGVGTELLQRCLEKTQAHNREIMVLVVPESCLDMQLFLRACGVRCKQIHRDYFQTASGTEDGYRFLQRTPIECEIPF